MGLCHWTRCPALHDQTTEQWAFEFRAITDGLEELRCLLGRVDKPSSFVPKQVQKMWCHYGKLSLVESIG